MVGKQVGKQAIIRKWTNDQEGFRLRSRWRWEVGGGRWEVVEMAEVCERKGTVDVREGERRGRDMGGRETHGD